MALALKEDRLFRIFLALLPTSYITIRDTLATTEDSVDNKLRKLEDKEDELGVGETQLAMAAKDKHRYHSRRRGSDSSSQSPPRRRTTMKCFLCEGRHSYRECPDLNYAQRLVQRKRLKDSLSRKSRTPSSSRDSRRSRSDDKRTKSDPKAKDRKSRRAYDAESDNSADSESSEPESGPEPEEIAAVSKSQAMDR